MQERRIQKSLILWGLVFCGLVPQIFAQPASRQPLEFEVSQSNWALRTAAPVPLKVRVTCSSPSLIEGNLEIRVLDPSFGLPIASIKLDDQVYSPGQQEVEYLLPIQSFPNNTPFEVEFRFRGKAGENFYSKGLLVPPTRRSFICPVVRGQNELDTGDSFGWLTLESRCPKSPFDSTLSPMVTQVISLEARDMPRDPLKHLPHDIVLVEPTGFIQMQTQQIVALEAWVRGGGSLFLEIDEQDLPTEQQAFVDRLIAPMPDLLSDEVEGTTLIPVIRGGIYASIEYGLGHVLFTTKKSWQAATESTHRECFCAMWRLRPEQQSAVLNTGQLSVALVEVEYSTRWNNYQYMNTQQLQEQVQILQQQQQAVENRQAQTQNSLVLSNPEILNFWSNSLQRPRSNTPKEIVEALLPKDVRTVPIWLISTILLAYVAAIGFGDYLILGRLRRRRWTWFTFPAMTLLVSLLTIGTAKGYLSSDVEVTAVEFRDVVDDGSIVRLQRFELHYRSSPGEQITPMEQVAFTPVSRQSAHPANGPGQIEESLDQQMVAIRGVPTQQAEAFQSLEQWRPQLNRFVSFPRGQTAPLTLAPLKPELPADSQESITSIMSQVNTAFPNAVYVAILRENGFLSPPGAPNQSLNTAPFDYLTASALARCSQRPDLRSPLSPAGVFSLVQQVSPCADVALTDLVIASPKHLVLCVAVREPDGCLAIYRYRIRMRG